MSDPLIRAEGLCLAYDRSVAFRDVSLSIHRGRITAIVGPSGCGKTSFLTCLNRMTDLVPSCRVTGSLRLEGEDVLAPRLDVSALRRRVGMILQKPSPFPLSIHENLALPLREHVTRDRATIQGKIEEAFREVGLWDEVRDRLDRPAQSLSGGQQQRLSIARSLVLRPEVLLLDEPCSALDPISSGVVEDLIVRMKGSYTLVVVTHNLGQARRIADDAAVFWVSDGAGRLIESGPAERIFKAPENPLTAAYINGVRG